MVSSPHAIPEYCKDMRFQSSLYLGISASLLFLLPSLGIRIAVIGGGAAGFFAGIRTAELLVTNSIHVQRNCEITIFESTKETLSKVLISGGGRCNVCHNPLKPVTEIAKGYPRGNKELLGPLSKLFGPQDTYDWFISRGVQLKTESDGRVFPTTDRAQSIKDALEAAASRTGILKVESNKKVKNVIHSNGKFRVSLADETIGPDKDLFDRLIIATGSAKVGHTIAESLGHSIVPPIPSLFSFKINDSNLTDLSGLSTETSRVKLLVSKVFASENKELVKQNLVPMLTQTGPVLITHQGLSGPGILKLSAYGARIMAELKYRFEIEIAWICSVTNDELISRFQREKTEFPNRSIGRQFPDLDDTTELLSKRLWQYLITRSGLSSDTVWQKLSKSDISRLALSITACKYLVEGRGLYRDEFVTAGGVKLTEVNFETMESKIVPGLYFAGEVLDIDGITGGYNFQSAWTSGWVAGSACGSSL